MDLATLAVKVDAAGATQQLDRLNRSLDQTAAAGAAVERGTAATNRALGTSATAMQSATRNAVTLATSLATTGRISTQTAGSVAASAATFGSAFGPGGIAALAVVGFASNFIGEMLRVREEMKRLETDWRETLDKLVNAGNNTQLRKLLQDIDLGTPAKNFEDGIQATQRRIDEIKRGAAELGAIGQLGIVFNSKALKAEEANLATLKKRYEELAALIIDPRNALRTRGSALPITITADDPNRRGTVDERTAWEESRRRAEQRQRWELEAIDRANRLAAARINAEMAGLRAPGASATTLGAAPSTLTGGVQSLPLGMRAAPGLTEAQGQAVAAARSAIALREAMEQVNSQIARNFTENMQRAVGFTFTSFIAEGRVSVRDLFSTFKNIGASAIGETLAAQLSRVTTNLGFGPSLVAGGALGFLGSVAEKFFGAAERQQAAAEAIERASADRRSTFAQISQDVGRFAIEPTLTQVQRDRLQGQRTAAGFADDLLNTIGSRNLSTTARRAFDAARAELGSIDFDELDRLRELLRGFAFPADLALLERIRDAYRENIAASERLANLQTADRLRTFGGGLSLSTFSPLSPTAQLREARAQYQSLLSRALGGDRSAADQFQTSAQTLLGLSRSVNASGGRFVADFNSVTADTARLEALFRDRATVAEETRDATAETAHNTERGNAIAADGFTVVGDQLAALNQRMDDLIRLQREAVA